VRAQTIADQVGICHRGVAIGAACHTHDFSADPASLQAGVVWHSRGAVGDGARAPQSGFEAVAIADESPFGAER
jgi:hypothetical protein